MNMKAIDIAKKHIGSIEWEEGRDVSIQFVNSCFEEAGIEIPCFKTSLEAVKSLSKLGKKISKDKVKKGDICISELPDDNYRTGIYLRQGGNNVKFYAIEAYWNDAGNFVVSEKIRKYSDAVFVRIGELEEIEVKKSKKK